MSMNAAHDNVIEAGYTNYWRDLWGTTSSLIVPRGVSHWSRQPKRSLDFYRSFATILNKS
jgi:hypothetical protein